MNEFTAILLAAGKGERMKSPLPKVLCLLRGKPLIYYNLREIVSLKRCIKQIIIVVGFKGKIVEQEVQRYFLPPFSLRFDKKNVEFVYQEELLGTADAVKAASGKIKHDNIIITCADAPLLTAKTLASFIDSYVRTKSTCSVLTAEIEGQTDLGRILRDDNGNVMGIQEKIDLQVNEKKDKYQTHEVNSGAYLFSRGSLLGAIDKIPPHPQKKEYFLTDIIAGLYNDGFKINAYSAPSSEEVLGVNTKKDLARAEKIMQERIIDEFINKGVKVMNPESTFIEEGVKIGKDTRIYPFTFIEKDVIIGRNCSLGPFIHLREGTKVADGTELGNFTEIVRSRIGKEVKIKHFSYLGDATVHDKVNIGAGTVVANFDGKNKNKTTIGKNAFIGSDTVLVAPVKVGKSSVTGAGSVVIKNVKLKTVVVGVPARFLRKK